MNDKLEELYQKYWMIHTEMLEQGFEPMEIAGVLTAHAMIMYKTLLSPKEFNIMVDGISDSRDKVKKLDSDITLQ